MLGGGWAAVSVACNGENIDDTTESRTTQIETCNRPPPASARMLGRT